MIGKEVESLLQDPTLDPGYLAAKKAVTKIEEAHFRMLKNLGIEDNTDMHRKNEKFLGKVLNRIDARRMMKKICEARSPQRSNN